MQKKWPDFRFTAEEMAGAVGDFGTLFPIIIAVAVVSGMDLGPILLFMGIAYIITGLYYKLPMPVEPMKSIGAVAIAGGLSQAEIISSAMMMGLILLFLSYTNWVSRLKSEIPEWLVRGIQLGLSFILLEQAISFILGDIILGLTATAVIVIFIFLPIKDISSLLVLTLGLIIGFIELGYIPIHIIDLPQLNIPPAEAWLPGLLRGVFPQLPLTLANAVLATALIIDDLFEKKVPEEKLLKTMGFYCLFFSPFGAFPMCHGSGGLAAQYRFGARTGGSNIISGIIILLIGIFFASPQLLEFFPYGVLGALLIFSSLQMLKSGKESKKPLLSLATAFIAFLADIGIAFVVMLVFILISRVYKNIY
ncbi:putative sulfate/molybdate transporter [Halanaerobium sp. Z-7514]|uniref:Sulfate/molybdate transporter n=1 Tax=Halanaerobium polyolivorans TaxID=2886943 RepID=A0AAW4WXF0_9FIRM|nr:putative sulfate/molybdate transporter [Halanaerobium polyolivorans]MCC3144558.1 putative sulfate/molybdate transporter [Halanaerobium polyolivorans]RQD72984.1 MAG: sulfate transporter [Halanaerobium sp. MSAO_Bac5]